MSHSDPFASLTPHTPFDIRRRKARLVVSPRGGPIRLIITGRKVIPTGRWYSTKNGRCMPWESKAERDLCIVAEADTDVIRFLVQPHRLEIDVGEARPLVYIPDAEHVLASGVTEIIEVKRAGEKLEPDYERKLELAAEIYRGLGWRFRIMRDAEIRREPRFPNAKIIASHGPTLVTSEETLAALDLIDRPGGSTYGCVGDVLGGGPQGVARLHALVVRRLLTFDLDRPIRSNIPVTLVADHPDRRRPA
ncbi:hypothetical protein [Lichenifustis flavocetrariae]|uniref:TnsA endonuclease N-terminal domain-containing protein n=1 Tax=Lichenifustis flavocetrariae TaxID=2949735 RepID=A0AA41YYY3_9HYPH|nr:hypothetical protein [Lichenifustis flavocetrariae]MCW6509866.1 hypothetical protein [Lichenifustis flavocetrariae]